MIKLNSAIPLYQQVAEDLKNRIEQGEFCSGQSIQVKQNCANNMKLVELQLEMQLQNWLNKKF